MPAEATRAVEVSNPDGFRLHATVSGMGGRVLLGLHGGPGGTGGGYLGPLHRLASTDRTVVTFDQLGTGRSEVPPNHYRWSMASAVADVEAVRNHLGVEQVDLLGHSWGGMLALQYTLDHHDHVHHLVLSNATGSSARITVDAISQLSTLLSTAQVEAAITADAFGEHDSPDFLDAVVPWLRRYGTTADDDLALMTTEALSPGPAGLGLWGDRLWFANGPLRGWNVEARLTEITTPTLVIHGGADMSTAETNRVLANGIHGAEWLTLNNNGHSIFEARNVATYLAILREFLNGWMPDDDRG